MNYPKAYLDAILAGRETVSADVRQVYEREVAWMDNPPAGYKFDEARGAAPIRFIEDLCKNSKGEWIGKPLRLELFQKAKLQLVFGWLDAETGARRIREVVDIRGRKCGKSVETAAVELYCMLGDGEGGAEIYCTANKKDQARVVFDEVANMREQSPTIRQLTRKRQSDIYFPETFSSIKALASDTKTMDGLNAHFFSLDEFHEARTSKVYDVMVQSQQARRQPLAWLISTNGFVREAFFDAKYAYCRQVARWAPGFEDLRTLPLLHMLDDRAEWTDRAMWPKANPGLGKIKSRSTLTEGVEKARRDPTYLPTLLTKDFNIPETGSRAWLPYNAVVNEAEAPMDFLRGSYAIGGCDLSAVRDLTCATVLIYKPETGLYYVIQQYFLPQARARELEQSNAREAPYQLWADQGWITLCDSATVDYRDVTQWFVRMVIDHDIRPLWVGYDRALAGYWQQEMAEQGFDMEKIAQGPITWSYPMKRLGGLLEDHRVVYQNNPVLRWCLLNTQEKALNKGGVNTIQPVKEADRMRIDGMVSLLNAFTSYCNHEEEYLNYVTRGG